MVKWELPTIEQDNVLFNSIGLNTTDQIQSGYYFRALVEDKFLVVYRVYPHVVQLKAVLDLNGEKVDLIPFVVVQFLTDEARVYGGLHVLLD